MRGLIHLVGMMLLWHEMTVVLMGYLLVLNIPCFISLHSVSCHFVSIRVISARFESYRAIPLPLACFGLFMEPPAHASTSFLVAYIPVGLLLIVAAGAITEICAGVKCKP